MKIVSIISPHNVKRIAYGRRPKAGMIRAQCIVQSGKRGMHTKHLEIPVGFSPATKHVVESIENGTRDGIPQYKLVVKML